MSEVRKVFSQDFEFIKPLLEKFDGSGFSVEKWRKLFKNYWSNTEDHIGYMLIDNGCAVGFIGTIFCERLINGKLHKICNLSSWFVLPEYRSESLLLFQQILKNKEFTVTSFTSIPAAIKILTRIGFRQLDTHYYWYTTNHKKRNKKNIGFITERDEIEKILNDEEMQIFKDHLPFNANHYIITDNESYGYLILRYRNTSLRNLISNRYINYADFIIRKLSGWSFLQKKITVAYLNYASNTGFLFEHIDYINEKISGDLKVSGLLIESRFVPMQKKMNRHKTCPRISLYRPADLKPSEIDSLYSELFILDMQ